MELAARTAAWAKSGGWVNPYVTYGLVAMWDGEWNAGGGVHDPSISYWEDIVSGIRLYFQDDSYIVNDKSISLAKKTQTAVSELAIGNECVTLEIVISSEKEVPTGVDPGIHNVFFQFQSMMLWRYQKNFAGQLEVDTQADSSFNYERKAYVKNDLITVPSYYSAIGGPAMGDDQIVYRNNALQSVVFDDYYFRQNLNGNVFLGMENPHINGVQTIFCARAYNRALSPAEIAANYAVDKARFNLPDAA